MFWKEVTLLKMGGGTNRGSLGDGKELGPSSSHSQAEDDLMPLKN